MCSFEKIEPPNPGVLDPPLPAASGEEKDCSKSVHMDIAKPKPVPPLEHLH